MTKTLRVLVFPAGTEIGLEIHRSLQYSKNIHIMGAGFVDATHGPYVFKDYFPIPDLENTTWEEDLQKIVNEKSIDYIFPAHDEVSYSLSKIRDHFKCKILTPDHSICELGRFKSKAFEAFEKVVPLPKRYMDDDELKYPLFVKPNRGQGSIGAKKISSELELTVELRKDPSLLVLEYLPGQEFTIDCFSTKKNGLIYCQPRLRKRIKSGISMNCISITDPYLSSCAEKISDAIGMTGAWFFQMKDDKKGIPKFLEFGPRIAGTMALSRAHGVNLPLLTIFEHEKIPIKINTCERYIEIDRALINRYKHDLDYQSIYVDLEETLIIGGRVNVELISFIYQCINERKKIYLITKAKGDISLLLRRYCLSGLFSEVYQLKNGDNKSSCILDKNSIFIDDSWEERNEVFNSHKIPVFDIDQVEVLLDYRR